MPQNGNSVDRRSFLKSAGGAAVAATLAGCAGGNGGEETTTTTTGGDETTTEETTSEEKTILTYARGNDSGTIDPQNTTSGEDAKVTNQVYDKPIHFKPGGSQLVDGLATEYSVDGTMVSLTFREGVMFHNGEEMTASDFVATYRRFLDPEYEYYPGKDYVSGYGPYSFGVVNDVSEAGDYQVEIELEKKYAPILRNLAMFIIGVMPETAIQEKGTDLSTEPVGTGPFVFDSWDTGNQRIRLSRNDEYWGEMAKVDEVVFTAISSNQTRAQTLDTGDVDIIDGLGAQSSQIVENSDNAELVSKPGINIGYMAFNIPKVEAFQSKEVRQAISHAINTKAIVDTIFKGIAVQASQPIPSNVMGYNEELDPYPYDPEQAQSLLDEAGYGDGFEFELATFKNPRTYNPSPLQAAQTVKSNLNEVGITVNINQQPFNPFLDYTAAGKHDACFLGWMTDNADPDNFYYALLHPGIETSEVPEGQDWAEEYKGGLHVSGWANTEFMDLVKEAQETYDDDARVENYREAGQIAHEEAPWVFMDHAQELRGVHNRVSGFELAVISGPFLNLVSKE